MVHLGSVSPSVELSRDSPSVDSRRDSFGVDFPQLSSAVSSSMGNFEVAVGNSCDGENGLKRFGGMQTSSTCSLALERPSDGLHDEVRKGGTCSFVGKSV